MVKGNEDWYGNVRGLECGRRGLQGQDAGLKVEVMQDYIRTKAVIDIVASDREVETRLALTSC